MTFEKVFKKDEVKKIAKSKSDFIYGSKHAFFAFYRDFEKLKAMPSIHSKHERMADFNKRLITFKNVKGREKNLIKSELRKMSTNVMKSIIMSTRTIMTMKKVKIKIKKLTKLTV